MIFCQKCSRILDEDVKFCPYCGSRDESFSEANNEKTVIEATASENELDNIFDNNKQEKAVEHNFEVLDTAPVENSKSEHRSFESKYEYSAKKSYEEVKPAKEPTSLVIKVILFLVTLIFMPVGFVVGIIFLTRDNKADKTFGIALLVFSIIVLIGACGGCAVFANYAYMFS